MNTNYRWYMRQLLSIRLMEIIKIPDLSYSPKIPLESDFEVSLLKEEGIPELMDFHDSLCIDSKQVFSASDVKRRLKAGDMCYCAHGGERLMGFCWFKTGSIYSTDLHCLFEFGNKSAIIYNGFIDPACRGKNVFPAMIGKAFHKLAEAGYKDVYGYMRSSNKSSKRALDKYNRWTVGWIYYGYLLGYHLFMPLVPENAGVTMTYDGHPWHRWQGFFQKRLSGIGAHQ